MRNSQFNQEFDQYSNYLKRFALKLTKDKNTADDLFQETALSAFRYQKKYRANSNFKAWLSTIMKNVFINQYRKQRRINDHQAKVSKSDPPKLLQKMTNNDGETNIAVKEILQIVNSLDAEYRIPFLMVYQGYKYDEIQKTMNLPMGTIKSKIHHARRILKHQINKMHAEVAA